MTELYELKEELTPEQEAEVERYWLNVNEADAKAWRREIIEDVVRAEIYREIEQKIITFLKYLMFFFFFIFILDLAFNLTPKSLSAADCTAFEKNGR